jgi:3-deoxy-D-manno-octulosonate 8-phosphate phosphatase KdsC-like HAD superfamily phosphatase
LGITDIHLGTDKVETFKEYAELYAINQNMFYIWETIFRFSRDEISRSSTCPKDSSPEIKSISTYISHRNGGKGAVRDVIEQVRKYKENGCLPLTENWINNLCVPFEMVSDNLWYKPINKKYYL